MKGDNIMNGTGMFKRVDELGIIVIPSEIRESFNIQEKDAIEIFVEKDLIILKKYNPNCLFCGETENLVEYKEKIVCKKCIKTLNMN